MSSAPPKGDRPFLARWSQRKLAAAREADASNAEPPQATTASPPVAVSGLASAPSSLAAPHSETACAPALPPVDALTFDSDFSAFLAPEVDASLRRQALRRLFSDPRFNVMDGLDVYIDDYNKFEPMPVDIVAKLRHAKDVLDPPRTRVNAQGHVEDVPPEEEAVAAEDAEPDTVAALEPPGAPTAAETLSGTTLADADVAPSVPAADEGKR